MATMILCTDPSEAQCGGVMHAVRFSTNVAVFLLFFGVALLDALMSGNLLRAAFWVILGLFFLRADALKPRK